MDSSRTILIEVGALVCPLPVPLLPPPLKLPPSHGTWGCLRTQLGNHWLKRGLPQQLLPLPESKYKYL